MQATRGKFLSGLIVLMALGISFASLGFVFSQGLIEQAGLGTFPGWFSPFVVGLLVVRLIALAAIWNLKRWGVYLFLALECLELVCGVFVFTSVLTLLWRLIIAAPSFLVVLAIWYLGLKPKWQAFT